MDDRETPAADPRAERHAATKRRILDEAWALAAQEGVAGLSLGELSRRVGLRQPSLYTYFASKNVLYDELFADGNRQLWASVVEREYPDDPREAIKAFARATVEFCAADVARYHLLFQRHVPSFEPSPESYALAEGFVSWARSLMERAGIESEPDRDVYITLIAGLADQQVANEPGGDRWLDLTDQLIDMLLDHLDAKGSFRR